MRKLKYHEQKLLKKVNFLEWKKSNTQREQKIVSKFFLQDRDDYHYYNCIVGRIRKLVAALCKLKDTDETKNTLGRNLVQRLYTMGVIDNKKLIECSKVSVSSFCKRRISYVMLKNKMVQHTKAAISFIEHGHVRLGPKIITNSGTIVSRGIEDFVKWVDTSKIKQKIEEFNDEHDEFNYN
ncbi:U3 small nucleolar ribonucleoprotein imp3 [Conglomerata obtusa]